MPRFERMLNGLAYFFCRIFDVTPEHLERLHRRERRRAGVESRPGRLRA